MTDLAIIVRLAIIATSSNQNVYEKMNFQQICYKNCRVVFRLVFQFTAKLLGSKKKKKKKKKKRLLVVCADGMCILVMYFWCQ